MLQDFGTIAGMSVPVLDVSTDRENEVVEAIQ